MRDEQSALQRFVCCDDIRFAKKRHLASCQQNDIFSVPINVKNWSDVHRRILYKLLIKIKQTATAHL